MAVHRGAACLDQGPGFYTWRFMRDSMRILLAKSENHSNSYDQPPKVIEFISEVEAI